MEPNVTLCPMWEERALSYQLTTSLLLGALILCAIVGNSCVVAAVSLERSLQTVANFLVGSLAVTDLMVSVLVLPMAALYQVSSCWTLGALACHVFVSLDMLCCTSSILHLSAIALDRYWAIVTPPHPLRRTPRHIVALVAATWLVSFLVTVPPTLVMRSRPRSLAQEFANPSECRVWQDPWYTVYSTFGAFYIPLAFMLVLYGRIFKAARFRIRRSGSEQEKKSAGPSRGLFGFRCRGRVEPLNGPAPPAEDESVHIVNIEAQSLPSLHPQPLFQPNAHSREAKRKLALARERKAVKTLGFIMGSFILCWLPFFIVALVMPFCQRCSMPGWLQAMFNWLGYSNSLLNPVIYAFCNKDFRRAFRKILHCSYCGP